MWCRGNLAKNTLKQEIFLSVKYSNPEFPCVIINKSLYTIIYLRFRYVAPNLGFSLIPQATFPLMRILSFSLQGIRIFKSIFESPLLFIKEHHTFSDMQPFWGTEYQLGSA